MRCLRMPVVVVDDVPGRVEAAELTRPLILSIFFSAITGGSLRRRDSISARVSGCLSPPSLPLSSSVSVSAIEDGRAVKHPTELDRLVRDPTADLLVVLTVSPLT